MTQGPDRHLAAIVALDIAGYSRLMGEDEQGTFQRMLDRRRTVIDPLIEQHRGRVVKGTGDGVLAQFGSAQDAIRSAVDIQAALGAANAAEPDAAPMVARIGITIGDIIFESGDIFGDGVNIAARLEGKAPPGGICVSGRVLDDLQRVGLRYGDWGLMDLKNIDRPVRVYCIPPAGEEPTSAPAAGVPLPTPRIGRRAVVAGSAAALGASGGGWYWWRTHHAGADDKSIVVLPFANLSGDPSQAYFSDGITEEVRSVLANIPQLRIIGRVSSNAMRNIDPGEIVARFGIGSILTGSVQRSPASIRVSAQLVNAAKGDQLWSDDYDRPAGDTLLIESDIAKSVAASLALRLGTFEAAKGTANPQAHDDFLKAIALWWSDDGSAAETKALIDAAITADPHYAQPYAIRSDLLLHAASQATNATDAKQLYLDADQAARRAIALAPRLAAGYSALGLVFENQLDARGALDKYRRAQALGPGSVNPSYVFLLSELGYVQEALTLASRTVDQDPLSADAFGAKAFALWSARQYPEAIVATRQALALAPKRLAFTVMIGQSLILLGRPKESLQALSALPDDDLPRLTYATIAADKAGDRVGSDRMLARLMQAAGDNGSYQYAEIYAWRGDREQALAAIEAAPRIGDPGLISLRTDPFLDPIRNEARFKAVLAKLNLP